MQQLGDHQEQVEELEKESGPGTRAPNGPFERTEQGEAQRKGGQRQIQGRQRSTAPHPTAGRSATSSTIHNRRGAGARATACTAAANAWGLTHSICVVPTPTKGGRTNTEDHRWPRLGKRGRGAPSTCCTSSAARRGSHRQAANCERWLRRRATRCSWRSGTFSGTQTRPHGQG